MGRHLTPEERQTVIRLRYDEEKSVSYIVDVLNTSQSTVYGVLAEYRKTGQTSNSKPDRRGTSRVLSRDDVALVKSTLKQSPSVFLDEVQDALENEHGRQVSLTTCQRTVERLGFTNKAVSFRAAQRDPVLRATWQLSVAGFDPNQLVFVDECGVLTDDFFRRRGWAPKGQPCVRAKPFAEGERVSVIPAMSLYGFLAVDILAGGVTRDRFVNFLEQHLIFRLNPYPDPCSVVIMDNASIHHGEDVRDAIEAAGAKLVYLPPYSPDLNPIEEAFSAVKYYLRRQEARATDDETRHQLINEALAAISREDIEGWFSHSGYM